MTGVKKMFNTVKKNILILYKEATTRIKNQVGITLSYIFLLPS